MKTSKELDYIKQNNFNNPLELFSFYGTPVFVSSGYYHQDDYFVVLSANMSSHRYAVLFVSREYDELISKATEVEAEELLKIFGVFDFSTGINQAFFKFDTFLKGYGLQRLSNRFMRDMNECKKSNPLNYINNMIYNIIVNMKPDKTYENPIIQKAVSNLANVPTLTTNVLNIYGTGVNLVVEWAQGSPVFKFEAVWHSHRMHRRIFVRDIDCIFDFVNELSDLKANNKPDEYFDMIKRFFQD